MTQDIYTWDIEKLWNAYNTIIEEGTEKDYTKDTETIKNGKWIKIPIYYLTQHWYEEYPSSGKVKIQGHPTKYSLGLFREEIELRESKMRSILKEELTEAELYEGRAEE